MTSVNQSACPDARQLEGILMGLVVLSDDEAARLEKHLTECPRCNDAARSMTGPADSGSAASLPELIARVRASATSRATPAPEATIRGGAPGPAPPQLDCTFLTPAQGAGELGRLGPYRVLKVLGAGGMGVVFEAEDAQLKRRVALKVMRPEFAKNDLARQRFLREAQATAAIEHDHIIPIYQVGTEGGVSFLAMPLLRGQTLDAWLKKEGRLAVTDALRVGREIAEGLAAAHECGLIHRDIKPANVWLEDRGRVKILDFGLARAEVDDAHLTATGIISGTPAYMAPEQAAGTAVDHRCDLFSLGSVLYEMTTGRLPFPGANPIAVLRALAVETPRPVRDLNPAVPPALADLTTRLLAKDPNDRPQTARAVADALASIERQQAEPPRKPRGRRLALIGAACALLLLGAAGWYYGPAVYRFSTNQGQVVVETDDPDVEVTVRGDVVKIVDAKSGHEVTVRAGKYQLELTKGKDGLKLSTSEFTLERGGKQIVKVTREAAAPDREPFVVVAEGKAERWFATLPEALTAASDGDAVEVRGDGPFVLAPLDLQDKPLVLRAGKGFRPVLALASEGIEADRPLLTTRAALVLEGLEFQRDEGGKPAENRRRFILSQGGPLAVTHCRLVFRSKARGLISAIRADSALSFRVQNCQFLGDWHAGADMGAPARSRAVIGNCLFLVGNAAINFNVQPGAATASLQVLNNTMITRGQAVIVQLSPGKLAGPPPGQPAARIEARRNVCGGGGLLHFNNFSLSKDAEDFLQREHRALAQQTVGLEDHGNQMGGTDLVSFAVLRQNGAYDLKKSITTLDEWCQFWKLDKTDSFLGQVRFQAEDLGPDAKAPERFTPQDFHLRAGGAARAELGADVDAVGPGPAYERWKTTPEYQQWRKDTAPKK